MRGRLPAWFPLRPDESDVVFRLEREFRVKIDRRRFTWKVDGRHPQDFTAGQLHDWVCGLAAEQGRAVPRVSWRRVQRVLTEMTGASPWRIKPGSYVGNDLRLFEGG